MVDFDLFGEVPKQVIAKSGGTQPRGYAAQPSSGPDGMTCRKCDHYIIRYTAAGYTHPKCGLMRHIWTNGRASDIKVSAPACSKFVPEVKNG